MAALAALVVDPVGGPVAGRDVAVDAEDAGGVELDVPVFAGHRRSAPPALLDPPGAGGDAHRAGSWPGALAGIAWPRLLWARPRAVREALAATEAALTGGLSLVVLDLGLPPLPGGRGAEAMWLRLARSARQHDALLVVASPYRVAGPAASTVLELSRGHALWSGTGAAPRLLEGANGRLTLTKAHRLLAPHGERLRLALPA